MDELKELSLKEITGTLLHVGQAREELAQRYQDTMERLMRKLDWDNSETKTVFKKAYHNHTFTWSIKAQGYDVMLPIQSDTRDIASATLTYVLEFVLVRKTSKRALQKGTLVYVPNLLVESDVIDFVMSLNQYAEDIVLDLPA